MNEIVHGDAMKLLKNTPDNSVDLIILDPDYQDWDKFIGDGIITESIRAIKESGNILCFTKQPFDYTLRIVTNQFFRREIIWSFENGGAWVSKQMPLVSYQKIYWLVKSGEFYFNPRTGVEYSNNTREFKRTNKVFGGYFEDGKDFKMSDEGVWLRDHLHYNKPNCGDIPAKPKELIEIFVKCFCPVGGTVLDLFSGSGIVSVVAKESRRNSKGSEINPERAKDIEQKLKEPLQMSIFDYL